MTVAVVTVPSPRLIDAVKSLLPSVRLVSVKAASPSARPWYLKGAPMVLGRHIESGDHEAKATLGIILHEMKGDFESRLEADPIWESWRQSSGAPVTNSRNPELWT
jgi:hypothetical protein